MSNKGCGDIAAVDIAVADIAAVALDRGNVAAEKSKYRRSVIEKV